MSDGLTFLEIEQKITSARQTFSAADKLVNDIARFLINRLNKVDNWVLVKLKKELSNYDAKQRVWKQN